MDISKLLEIVIITLGVLVVVEYLRYEYSFVNAWWHKKLTQEMRAASSWADCRKMVRVYKSEVANGKRN